MTTTKTKNRWHVGRDVNNGHGGSGVCHGYQLRPINILNVLVLEAAYNNISSCGIFAASSPSYKRHSCYHHDIFG